MASATPITSSSKETTNYARLCRLLVDIGTQALRDTLDGIHAPANLHTILAANKATLQSLKAKKIINPTQWGKLFPAIPNSVSSSNFDTTLLTVLLRNLCGLTTPPTGWDTLPAVTDLSKEADIARVKYFRNTVYGHAEKASVDDVSFNDFWRDIRDTLIRLGGATYQAAIDTLRTETMDPDLEDHYMGLLSEWKKDEDNVKEELGEMKKLLHALTLSKEVADKGTVTAQHEIKLKVLPTDLDAEKHEIFDLHFTTYISIFMRNNKLSSTEGMGEFLKYIENSFNLLTKALGYGCLEIRVQCRNLESLERLWEDCRFGKLNVMAEKCLVTDELKMKLDVEALRLNIVIKEEDYLECQKSFLDSEKLMKDISVSGPPKAPHKIKLRVVPQNLDFERQDTSSRQFTADIDIFLKPNTFSPTEGLNIFLKYLENTYNLSIKAFEFDGLEIRVECITLEGLERLWEYFDSRKLDEIAKTCILTKEVKQELKLKNMRLTTVLKEEDNEIGRESFIKRAKPSNESTSQSAVRNLRERTVRLTAHNVGGEKLKGSNQNFGADVSLFMNCNTFSPTKGLSDFLHCIEDACNLRTKALGFGCLEIGLECASAEGLECLWTDYESGHLNETAERCFLTDEVNANPKIKDVRLKTVIKDGEYFACRKSFFKPRKSKKGHLNETVDRSLLTDEITENPQIKEVRATVVKDEEYFACRKSFFKPRKSKKGHLNEIVDRSLLTDEITENPQIKEVRTTVIKDGEHFASREPTEIGVSSSGTVTEPHEISIKIIGDNVDALKKEKLNQYFQEVESYSASSQTKGLGDFLSRFKNEYTYCVHIKAVGLGSLEIQVQCPTLEILENLKRDYCSGHLNEMAEECILTNNVRQKLNLKDVSLKAVIKKEDYDRCRKSFMGPSRPSSEVTNEENFPSYHTAHSKSQAEGNGLKEAEQGAEANFTITTRDSEGKQFYCEQEHVTVIIRSRTCKKEVKTKDFKDGNYTVHYKPKSAGLHYVMVKINGWPLTGSPWRVNVRPHQYKVVKSFGSHGIRDGQFRDPHSIAKDEKTGEVAVADYLNGRLQVFDEKMKCIRTIGGETKSPTAVAVKIHLPLSVAFLRNGDMIIIHNTFVPRQMSLMTNDGQFIQQFSEHVVTPETVVVTNDDDDGHVIVCDGADGKIKVLSPDGAQLIQSFRVSDYLLDPFCAFYRRDKFFVSYSSANCVKVFNKEGKFLLNIGSKGSGEGEFKYPYGLVVDAFDNLIVCDTDNGRLQMFNQDGEFLCFLGQEIQSPCAITVCENGDLLVTDIGNNCVLVLR